MTLERLRNENEDKTKTQMTQSFNQYSENETKIWRQSIINQFNRVSSSSLRSHFVISLLLVSNFQKSFKNPPFYHGHDLCYFCDRHASVVILMYFSSNFYAMSTENSDVLGLLSLGASKP